MLDCVSNTAVLYIYQKFKNKSWYKIMPQLASAYYAFFPIAPLRAMGILVCFWMSANQTFFRFEA